MGIDDVDVRDLGLDLKQTPDATELRLPPTIGCAGGAGPGLFGLVALLFLAFLIGTAWRAPERSLDSAGEEGAPRASGRSPSPGARG